MKTLSREEMLKQFDLLWDNLTQEWFKIEVLQDYSGEDSGESLNAWLRGEKELALKLIQEDAQNNEWVNATKDKNFKKIRVHIVEEPYSPYVEWEIEHYKLVNIPLGKEEVYLVNKSLVENIKILDGDIMIFDNKKVLRSYYTPEGKMYKADFYDENDDIGEFLELKKKLLLLVKPLL